MPPDSSTIHQNKPTAIVPPTKQIHFRLRRDGRPDRFLDDSGVPTPPTAWKLHVERGPIWGSHSHSWAGWIYDFFSRQPPLLQRHLNDGWNNWILWRQASVISMHLLSCNIPLDIEFVPGGLFYQAGIDFKFTPKYQTVKNELSILNILQRCSPVFIAGT